MYCCMGDVKFMFEYCNCLYLFKFDLDVFQCESIIVCEVYEDMVEDEVCEYVLQCVCIVQFIVNCLFMVFYYQVSLQIDEFWYYFCVVFLYDGQFIKVIFISVQIVSSSEFKKCLLGVVFGVMYIGIGQQFDEYLEKQFVYIVMVQIIDFVGYIKEYGIYVYGDVVVKDGKLYQFNDEDFFDIGKFFIKIISQVVMLLFFIDVQGMQIIWLLLFWQVFGVKGLVVLVFWFGSLFVEQICQEYKSYFFLELVGEFGVGKMMLIEFLWKFCGWCDYEGFDLSKLLFVVWAWNFVQVVNLFVVFIEGDCGDEGVKQCGFDWDELKIVYNGCSICVCGMKNGGNEMYELFFCGVIVISQNVEVSVSDVVLQWIVYIYCDCFVQILVMCVVVEVLECILVEDVFVFLFVIVMVELKVLEIFVVCVFVYEQVLMVCFDIKIVCIVKNYV